MSALSAGKYFHWLASDEAAGQCLVHKMWFVVCSVILMSFPSVGRADPYVTWTKTYSSDQTRSCVNGRPLPAMDCAGFVCLTQHTAARTCQVKRAVAQRSEKTPQVNRQFVWNEKPRPYKLVSKNLWIIYEGSQFSNAENGFLSNDEGKTVPFFTWGGVQRHAFHLIRSQSRQHEKPSFDKHETLPFCCVLCRFCLKKED